MSAAIATARPEIGKSFEIMVKGSPIASNGTRSRASSDLAQRKIIYFLPRGGSRIAEGRVSLGNSPLPFLHPLPSFATREHSQSAYEKTTA